MRLRLATASWIALVDCDRVPAAAELDKPATSLFVNVDDLYCSGLARFSQLALIWLDDSANVVVPAYNETQN